MNSEKKSEFQVKFWLIIESISWNHTRYIDKNVEWKYF